MLSPHVCLLSVHNSDQGRKWPLAVISPWPLHLWHYEGSIVSRAWGIEWGVTDSCTMSWKHLDTHWENHSMNRYLGRDVLSLYKHLTSQSACSFCHLWLTSQEATQCVCAFPSMSMLGNSFVRNNCYFSSTSLFIQPFTYVNVYSGAVIFYVGF